MAGGEPVRKYSSCGNAPAYSEIEREPRSTKRYGQGRCWKSAGESRPGHWQHVPAGKGRGQADRRKNTKGYGRCRAGGQGQRKENTAVTELHAPRRQCDAARCFWCRQDQCVVRERVRDPFPAG